MCGISAFSGDNAVIKALMVTLGQLERGTKGCGVAFTVDNNIFFKKAPVHPVEFFNKHFSEFMKLKYYGVTCAIAHNRMPSAGSVSYENTHPFVSCDRSFALVHNGHAINHSYRHEIIAKGHVLKGETDSEVITHMIEEEVKTFGSVENVLLYSTLKYMDGAILVLTKDGTIYGIRTNHNPLYVGLGDNFVICGSTANAITHVGLELSAIIRLRVKQVVRIRKGKAEFLNEGEDENLHLVNMWNNITDYFRDFF